MDNVTHLHFTTKSTDDYQRPFDEIGIAVSAFVLITFLVVGVIGNGITIAVIVTYKSLRKNVFMRFILSLCVSDLISALISWIFLYRRTWGFDVFDPIPHGLCKFYWAADLMTSYVTAWHILSFAILRLISIQFPLTYNKINMIAAQIWIGILWTISFLSGFIPFWIFFGVGYPDRYSDNPDARWPACTVLRSQLDVYTSYQKVAYPVFLYLPTAGVVVVCVSIVFLVIQRSREFVARPTEEKLRKEKQAVLQLVLIIFSFLLGYIPFTAYEFWSVQSHPNTRYYILTDFWFGMIEYFLLRFSECLNPLFYNLGSAKVRKYTKRFLGNKLCYKKDKTRTTSNTVSDNASATTGNNFGV